MTRIVGGVAKGRRLAVPPAGTRPTSDRAREALFNTLAGLTDLGDAHLLDLYAGSGAVGLEALSRGAAQATLVESDRRALEVLRRNVEAVGLPGVEVVRADVNSYLDRQDERPARVAFADPPYALSDAAVEAMLAKLVDHLEPLAIVVIERSSRGLEPRWPEGIDALKQRRYGEGVLWYGRGR